MDLQALADKIHKIDQIYDAPFWQEFQSQASIFTVEQLDELDHLLDPLIGAQTKAVILTLQLYKARRIADEISDLYCGESASDPKTIKERICKFFWRENQSNYLKYTIMEYGLSKFSRENGLID